MFDSSAEYFEKMAEGMGIAIKIPRPSKKKPSSKCEE